MRYITKSSSIISKNTSKYLFELYSIDMCETFKKILLEYFKFSPRSFNALKRSGYNNAWDLLSMTESQLFNIRQIGPQKASEILKKIEQFESNPIYLNEIYNYEDGLIEKSNYGSAFTPDLRDAIENILQNKHMDIEALMGNETQAKIYFQLSEAVEQLGVDICSITYYEPNKVLPVIQVLTDFNNEISLIHDRRMKFQHLFGEISETWLDSTVIPLIMACEHNGNKHNDILSIFQESDIVKDLPFILGDDVVTNKEIFDYMCHFCKFLNVGFLEIIKEVKTQLFKDDKQRTVIECRASGGTLEEGGRLLGVTRERVRQIETRVKATFCRICSRTAILWLMCAKLNGEQIINYEKAADILGDDGYIYAYLLKISDEPYYTYNKTLQAFMLCEDKSEQIMKAIANLPYTIPSANYYNLLLQLNDLHGLQMNLLEGAFLKSYHLIGTIYSKKKMTLSEMYEYIILHFYPHGIKLFVDSETEKLKYHVKRVFGEIDFPNTNRAIDSRITDRAVLCDRGTYTHPFNINLPDELLQKISRFIEESERMSISYLELFDEFKNELLLNSNINNRYYLQGVLKLKLSGKYRFVRDYISKSSDFTLDEEIATFIESRVEVSKDEIRTAFSGISEAMFFQIATRVNDIISVDSGRYIHSSSLNITDSDYEMSTLINDNILEFPVSSRKLFELMSETYSEFLHKNDINTHSKLFGVLRYMFENKYRFSRPYIARKENVEVSKVDIIKTRFNSVDVLSIDELVEFCYEHCIEYQSLSLFILELNDMFFRLDCDTLINVESLSLSDDTLSKILSLLISDIEIKGYISAQKIDTFIYYPDLGVTWTGWLLTSIAQKHFVDICMLEFQSSNRRILNDVFISRTLEFERYDEFLKWLVNSENTRSPFRDFDDIKNWLVNEGLIHITLPKFLLEYIYKDEYGKIITL